MTIEDVCWWINTVFEYYKEEVSNHGSVEDMIECNNAQIIANASPVDIWNNIFNEISELNKSDNFPINNNPNNYPSGCSAGINMCLDIIKQHFKNDVK